MRITYDAIRDGLDAINTAAGQLADAQQQLATGRRVNAASDDPLATELGIGEQATVSGIDAYTRSRDSAAARLAATDNVLSGIVDKLQSAVVTATSARGSSVDPSAQHAAADQIRGLSQSLLADFNTTYNGTYLFSGTASNTPAYANVGGVWTYQGTTATMQVEVEKGRLVSVSQNGQAIAQGSDSQDLFTSLNDLSTALDAGDDAGIGAAMDKVNAAFQRALSAQGKLGNDERETDDATARLSALRTAAETRKSNLLDANMADAATAITASDNAYRAALASVSSAERLSLLDYLK
jgi:flagellar hook-associated protein 3 FlgL